MYVTPYESNPRIQPFVEAPSPSSVLMALAVAGIAAVATVVGIEFMGL